MIKVMLNKNEKTSSFFTDIFVVYVTCYIAFILYAVHCMSEKAYCKKNFKCAKVILERGVI